jgi:MOSC domain-containing protein YiiM
MANHLTMETLSAGLEHVRHSPIDDGVLEMIVRRPATDAREILECGELTVADGLVGDSWGVRRRSGGADPSSESDTQLTLMNARAIALVAEDRDRWPLAGDQLFVDLNLSSANLPPGTRLQIGTASIEITDQPHTGCRKFVSRFGVDAMKFVNSPIGRQLQLRGVYAKVIQPGVIRVGDTVKKILRAGERGERARAETA